MLIAGALRICRKALAFGSNNDTYEVMPIAVRNEHAAIRIMRRHFAPRGVRALFV